MMQEDLVCRYAPFESPARKRNEDDMNFDANQFATICVFLLPNAPMQGAPRL